MKVVFVLFSTALLLSFFQSCQRYEAQDLYGVWQIDQIMEDGMDRTGWAMQEFPWGTGMELKADGNFRTNFLHQEKAGGKWKISPKGDQLFLQFSSDEKRSGFRITLSQQHLVLKSLRWQVFLSKTDALPETAKKEVNLANNLPGIWYFYVMNTKDSVIHYPHSKKHAHWVHIDPKGFYRSGEGKHESFHGKWVLKKDTLLFSELDRVWCEQWKIRMENDMLYFESVTTETKDWYEVRLVHENHLVD